MEETLEQLLHTLVSPELSDTYLQVIDLLDEIGSTDHLDAIEQYMGMTDYQSGGEFNNMLRDTLERQLTYELGKFTIVLNPDVPYDLDFCTALLRAIYYVDRYPDGEAMLSALQTEDDDMRESLFRVLTIIDPLDEDEFFIQVESVSPALMTRLNSVYTHLPEAITEEVERLRDLVKDRTIRVREEALQFYTPFEGEITSEALTHIESVTLGYDIVPTLALLVNRIFQQNEVEAVADLALLCAGSNVSDVGKAFEIVTDRYLTELTPRTLAAIQHFNKFFDSE